MGEICVEACRYRPVAHRTFDICEENAQGGVAADTAASSTRRNPVCAHHAIGVSAM